MSVGMATPAAGGGEPVRWLLYSFASKPPPGPLTMNWPRHRSTCWREGHPLWGFTSRWVALAAEGRQPRIILSPVPLLCAGAVHSCGI